MPRRRSLVLGLGFAIVAPLASLGAPAAAAPAAVKAYDFNGDGLPDLAVGAPFLTDGKYSEGGVAVLAGSKAGLSKTVQVFTPDSPGVAGESGAEDEFGGALASGDFDGDGYADLAVGLPVAFSGGLEASGAITVLYGSAKGLTGDRSLKLSQPGGPESDTGFGSVLAAGDFDGDGRAELAASSHYSLGTVAVFRGGDSGLSQSRSSVLQGPKDSAADGSFGKALAVGDLDQDGRLDLAVVSGGADVNACYGAAAGLGPCTLLSRGAYEEAGGQTLAIGNVSGSSRSEVVVGIPYADNKSEGAVSTLSLSGPRASTTVTRTTLTQDSPGVRGTSEKNDDFGTSVALGDLDADGYADLVVGAPGEDKDKGRVTVVYGGKNGYRTSGGRVYDQNTKGIPGKAEKHDAFGASIALLDHDGDGHLDLSVGAPDENTSDGALTLLPGSGTSFTTRSARTDTLKGLGYTAGRNSGFGEPIGH